MMVHLQRCGTPSNTAAVTVAADDDEWQQQPPPPQLQEQMGQQVLLPSAEVPVVQRKQMSEREKFLFDLNGYITIPGFLTTGELASLNEAFDANWEKRTDCHQTPAYDEFGGMLTWEQPHCQPFRDLLAHPKLVPYLSTILGQGYRMDHTPFMITGEGEATIEAKRADASRETPTPTVGGGRGHGFSGPHFNGECYYRYANGKMQAGMLVCQFQLTDVKPGDGYVRSEPQVLAD